MQHEMREYGRWEREMFERLGEQVEARCEQMHTLIDAFNKASSFRAI